MEFIEVNNKEHNYYLPGQRCLDMRVRQESTDS